MDLIFLITFSDCEEKNNNNGIIRTASQKLLLAKKGLTKIGRQSNNETSAPDDYNLCDQARSISCDSQNSVFPREPELQTSERY